ncbi:hypothetical protein V8C26DRAFT_182211 [Trichoderma gracile]
MMRITSPHSTSARSISRLYKGVFILLVFPLFLLPLQFTQAKLPSSSVASPASSIPVVSTTSLFSTVVFDGRTARYLYFGSSVDLRPRVTYRLSDRHRPAACRVFTETRQTAGRCRSNKR